jgi:uncharacterized protein YndB with AHSA1/START domain
MAAQSSAAKQNESDREIVISRVFEAPRELVWNAWTDPAQVVRWWGPKGFTTTIHEMDLRPGGVWSHTMHGPDGTDYPNKSVFVEIVKHERIVFTHGGGREGGPGVHFQSTWTFEKESDDKTRLTLRMVFDSAEARETVVKEYGAIEGGKQTLERLAEFLPAAPGKNNSASESNPELVISRTFDAPRNLVFKAITEADRLAKWWGPKGFTWISGRLDLRPGGLFHYCMRSPDGHDMWGKFEYHEIKPPERLVFATSFSDPEGNTVRAPFNPNFPLQVLNTMSFTESQGKTTITMRGVPLNATEAERQLFAKWHPSMQQGFRGTFDQLDAYLSSLAKENNT